jgi:CubicO group peptidase (beta-lactamase class C family)
MVLVEDGAIDLDAPVSTYLTRWELPPGAFDVSGVTVRRLLSHTAGLSDGLGYDGFDAPQEVQTLEASLSRAADASPGNDGVVRLGAEPGEGWAYSGGGYTLLQLLVEEVSGQGFADFMDARVFTPLGMERTTFDHREALALGLAQNFDTDGGVEPFRWYTALAATSLFTTAGDLALFVQSQAPGGERPVLSEATLEMMRTPHASQLGADIWGLGLMLYAPNGKGSHIIGHDGNNGPAINTTARLDPDTGDGIVILATGSPLLATELAGEWVYWKTGRVDNLTFAIGLGSLLLWIGGGALVILVVGILVGWKSRKRRRAAHDFG